MTALHIACAADDRYVPHSAAMLHSVIANGGERIVVHYLHPPNFSSGDAGRLGTMFDRQDQQVVFHEIPADWVDGLPLQPLFGPVMWHRIFLPDLLPDVDRVLYLDVDTLVLDRLDPLWGLSLEGNYLGAVTNIFMPWHRHRPAEVGIDAGVYFNSGVLLFNLELMRADGFTRSMLELARSDDERLKWPDQDALNIVVGDRRLALHPRWNCMNSLLSRVDLATEVFGAQAVADAREAPAIRHFEGPGPNKPWHLMQDRAAQHLYRVHREATPWPDYKLEGATPANRAKRLAADLRRRVTG